MLGWENTGGNPDLGILLMLLQPQNMSVVPQAATYEIPKKEKRPRRWRSKNNGKDTKATLQVHALLLIFFLCCLCFDIVQSLNGGKEGNVMSHFCLYLTARFQAVSPPSPSPNPIAFMPPIQISPPLSQTPKKSVLNPQNHLQMLHICKRTSAN